MKRLLMIAAALCLAVPSGAQQTYTSQEMVAVTPMLSGYIDLPADAVRSLNMKLTQMVTQNGMGGASDQFVLTANVVTLDKQATATAPVQYIVELEVSFFVLNVIEDIIVDEMSFTVKGIDRQEHKAMIQAINQINARTPRVRQFMAGVRESIITYYNTHIPTILTKARSLAEREEYDEAMWVLSAVPETVDQYPMVAEQMTAIYLKKLDNEVDAALLEANGHFAVRDYERALKALQGINPVSTKAKEAFALVDRIKGAIDAEEQRRLAEELKRYEDAKEAAQRAHDDQVMLTKVAVEASREVGVEKAKTETSLVQNVNKWFLGKFNK